MKVINDVIKHAFEALPHAYAPYSNFAVGACVETKDHQFITGVNIENASYGLTNCAERSALFAAYSKGYRKEDIVNMAVVTTCDHIISPCGACRQVMMELLNKETPIWLANKNEQKLVTVEELMPLSFSRKDLL